MLYLGADHRGFGLKESLKRFLTKNGIQFEDFGAATLSPDDDFIDYAIPVAQAVAADPAVHRGILMCGSGVGMDIAANKVRGVRAALVRSVHQAIGSRKDDDANVLVLDADETSGVDATDIVQVWLATPFSDEPRYRNRLDKLAVFEKDTFASPR